MAKVKLIVGLCGSGKSHLAEQLRVQNFQVFDEGVAPGWPNHDPFLEAIRLGYDCVAVEIGFRLEALQTLILSEIEVIRDDVQIEWLVFANDPATADHNCRQDTARKRDVAGNIACNAAWTIDYSVPVGVTPLTIHKL